MNNLKTIMEARNITPLQLSEMTGLAVTNIRRILQEDSYSTSKKSTQQIIAAALGVTVRELVQGGKRMKKKILEAEVRSAVEALVKALRNYSDEGLYLSFFTFTHDTDSIDEDNPNEVPDYYSIRILKPFEEEDDMEDADEDIDYIFIESGRIFYSKEDGEEGIRKVIPNGRGRNNE